MKANFTTADEKQDKISKLLTKLRLHKKRHDLARNLSGGQKRRLSLAIALVGGSQVRLVNVTIDVLYEYINKYTVEYINIYKMLEEV